MKACVYKPYVKFLRGKQMKACMYEMYVKFLRGQSILINIISNCVSSTLLRQSIWLLKERESGKQSVHRFLWQNRLQVSALGAARSKGGRSVSVSFHSLGWHSG